MTPGRLWPRARSIRLHFVSVLLVTAAVVASLVGSLAYSLAYRHSVSVARQGIEEMISALEKTAAIAAYTQDRVLMQEVVRGLLQNRLVSSVELVSGGKVVMSAARDGAGGADQQVSARVLKSPFDGAESVAELRVHPAAAFIADEAGREARTVVALSIVQVALAAIAMYLTAQRFVSRPIVSLARELGAMQPGSSRRLGLDPVHERDEIGLLVKGANALLQSNEDALARERSLRAEVELMEAQYRQIFDSTSAGIFLVDEAGRLINGNPTVLRVLGSTLQDLQRLKGSDFLESAFADPGLARDMIQRAAVRGETVSADLRLRRLPGEPSRWVHCLISVQPNPADTSLDGGAALVEGVMYDITERKAVESEVRRLAELDGLTGLRNRVTMDSAVETLLGEAQAGNRPTTLMLIDLDGFKAVNDQLGHQAGDYVLQECARRMSRQVKRADDVLGRLGGDEFAVALSGMGPEHPQVAEMAARLVESLCEPFELPDGRRATIGASIGIACSPVHGRSLAELSERADGALYMVKRHSKRGVAFATR